MQFYGFPFKNRCMQANFYWKVVGQDDSHRNEFETLYKEIPNENTLIIYVITYKSKANISSLYVSDKTSILGVILFIILFVGKLPFWSSKTTAQDS